MKKRLSGMGESIAAAAGAVLVMVVVIFITQSLIGVVGDSVNETTNMTTPSAFNTELLNSLSSTFPILMLAMLLLVPVGIILSYLSTGAGSYPSAPTTRRRHQSQSPSPKPQPQPQPQPQGDAPLRAPVPPSSGYEPSSLLSLYVNGRGYPLSGKIDTLPGIPPTVWGVASISGTGDELVMANTSDRSWTVFRKSKCNKCGLESYGDVCECGAHLNNDPEAVAPGTNVRVSAGMRIKFGVYTGEVRAS